MSHIITPSHFHLGDLINTVQNNIGKNIGIDRSFRCKCCDQDVYQTLKQIFQLLGLPEQNLHPFNGQEIFSPKWGTPYIKSVFKFRKEPIFSYNFACRSKMMHGKSKLPNRQLIEKVTSTNFNLTAVELTEDMSIAQKHKIIDQSCFYLGADNGLCHLSLMTATPIIVFHAEDFSPQRYYPPTNQMRFSCDIKDILKFCFESSPKML